MPYGGTDLSGLRHLLPDTHLIHLWVTVVTELEIDKCLEADGKELELQIEKSLEPDEKELEWKYHTKSICPQAVSKCTW